MRADDEALLLRDVRAAWHVSVLSIAWTVAASVAAALIGITSGTAVLVAFGAIGIVDAVGSVALASHFRHGLRNEVLSPNLERVAHRVVLVGLAVVGCGAVAGGVTRLAIGGRGAASNAGVVLAFASLGALAMLSTRKRRLAPRVSSNALRSDGHLSAVGAAQAGVTLCGVAAARWLGWEWADAATTAVVGSVAIALAAVTWRSERHPIRGRRNARSTFGPIALAAMVTIAIADALLGPRLILIGLLVGAPALAAMTFHGLRTAAVSAASVGTAVLLGMPDGIWLTAEHWVWIGGVALVGTASSVVVAILARPRTSLPRVGSRRL